MTLRHSPETRQRAQPSERLLIKKLSNGGYRYNEDGELERFCSLCREYWPADDEFFYANKAKPDGLSSLCKACTVECRYPNGKSVAGHTSCRP